MSNSNVRNFFIAEKRWIRISIPDQLEGAQITSVSWSPASPVTLVAGSSAVYTRTTTNDSVRARFDFAGTMAETRYSITATMTTNDGEEIKETVVVQIKALPV